MPPRRAVELRVGGQTYRVVATDDDHHVKRLAELVDRKFIEVVPSGRGVTAQQAMFLTAMALAHDAEEQRARCTRLEVERDRAARLAARAREVVARLLQKVDSALALGSPAAAGAAQNDGAKGAPEVAPVPPEPRSGPTPVPGAWGAGTGSTVDAITDPPDAVHEPVLIELLPSSRESAPPPPAAPAWAPAPASASAASSRAGLRLVRQTAAGGPWSAGAGAAPPKAKPSSPDDESR